MERKERPLEVAVETCTPAPPGALDSLGESSVPTPTPTSPQVPAAKKAAVGASEPEVGDSSLGPAARPAAAPRQLSWFQRSLYALRPVPLVLAVAIGLQLGAGVSERVGREPDRSAALVLALEDAGLRADVRDVHWVDEPGGIWTSRTAEPRAVVRAHAKGEPADIYLVTARLSPEGRLLELTGSYNLSDTSAVDEQQLAVSGPRAAWVISGGGKTYSVHYADLRGELQPSGPGWTRTKLWQDELTNLQQTGQRSGVGRRSFKLDPAAERALLGFSDDALLIDSDGRKIRVPTDDARAQIDGERFVVEHEHHKARPGNLVTWSVDRVRQSPWFSDDQMQYVKAVAFEVLDVAKRFGAAVTGDDGSEAIAEEAGDVFSRPPVEYTDPETGWPPPAMDPMLKPPLEGEGKWRSLEGDPFVRSNPGMPNPFVFSFIRTDRRRPYTRIYVLVWDPRQVQLHTMSGTVEPKSATGETGPGLVPRDPKVMGRLVAALNGGFQATHGEFGMMAEKVVYLPPKPYAATVAKLDDGNTGFGTWPREETVPDHIIGFRQNMTPLVMDGKINPYKRNWWGGVPPGWKDESRTVRSAICMTDEKFIAYLYGTSIDADHLAFAMQRARCQYAIHLDMNAGHTGLEFYKAAPTSELPELDRKLESVWEARGPVSNMSGWSFLGRRMIKYMGLMNFPRYINREARDFFYLTLRHVLPGLPPPKPTGEAGAGEGEWKVKGLPQHGWPYAIATSWLRPEAGRPETKVRLMKVDPKAVRPARKVDDKTKLVVALRSANPGAAEAGRPGLYHANGAFLIAPKPVPAGAVPVLAGFPPGHEHASGAVAAVGVGKLDGMLYYAEVATAPDAARDAELLGALLRRLGCEQVLLLDAAPKPALGGVTDLAGHPVARSNDGVLLLRAEYPGAKRIFTETPIVSPDEWYPLQAKRVRYFRKRETKNEGEGEGEGGE